VTFESVRAVLARVEALVDADARFDEADPYVLAPAIDLRKRGRDVVVVTEDRVERPQKTSLSSACGIFGIPSVALMPFLHDERLSLPSR
jgi:hypothetical protein